MVYVGLNGFGRIGKSIFIQMLENKYDHDFFYVSTGGGASIEFISNNSLIGLDFFNI